MELKLIKITDGLAAHPAVPAHTEALTDLIRRNADHLRQYLPAVAALDSVEEVRAHLALVADRAARSEVLDWHLFAGGLLCGSIRLNRIEPKNRKTSIAYFIDANYHGRGIVTCAVRAILGYCFGELGMNRVELTCATDNVRSIRVAERAGFVREGRLRQAEWLGESFVDHYVYAILLSDYLPTASVSS